MRAHRRFHFVAPSFLIALFCFVVTAEAIQDCKYRKLVRPQHELDDWLYEMDLVDSDFVRELSPADRMRMTAAKKFHASVRRFIQANNETPSSREGLLVEAEALFRAYGIKFKRETIEGRTVLLITPTVDGKQLLNRQAAGLLGKLGNTRLVYDPTNSEGGKFGAHAVHEGGTEPVNYLSHEGVFFRSLLNSKDLHEVVHARLNKLANEGTLSRYHASFTSKEGEAETYEEAATYAYGTMFALNAFARLRAGAKAGEPASAGEASSLLIEAYISASGGNHRMELHRAQLDSALESLADNRFTIKTYALPDGKRWSYYVEVPTKGGTYQLPIGTLPSGSPEPSRRAVQKAAVALAESLREETTDLQTEFAFVEKALKLEPVPGTNQITRDQWLALARSFTDSQMEALVKSGRKLRGDTAKRIAVNVDALTIKLPPPPSFFLVVP